MANVCGSSCENCEGKTTFGCKGCRESDGHPYYGECNIFSCCHGKGLDACSECGGRGLCVMLREADTQRDKQIEIAQRNSKIPAEKNEQMRKSAPLLGKWLTVLFWIAFPQMLASLFSNTQIASAAPGLELVGYSLSLICGIISVLAVWKMSPVNARYKKAAIAAIGGVIIAVVSIILTAQIVTSATIVITIIVAIIALIFSLYQTYCLFHANSEVLERIDDTLSANWLKLWKWYIGVFSGMVLGIVIMFASSSSFSRGGIIFGAIVLIVSGLGLVVVSIFELIYLYRSAKIFRDWSNTESPEFSAEEI